MPARPSPSERAARRARMLVACASIGVWPEELLCADFVDGLSSLAGACDDLAVTDVALASASADENPSLSAVARALLAERGMRRQIVVGAAIREDDSQAAPAARQRVPSFERGASEALPIDLVDFAGSVGTDAEHLARLLVPASPEAQASADAEGAPWLWPAPEVPRRVVAPAMTFSASRLNAFVKCPRRWYYEYLCDAVDDSGSVFATYGKVFHDALEALHREVRVPSNYAEEDILDRLRRELDAAFGRSHADFESVLEYEVCRLRARSVAAHYVHWLRREALARPLEVRDVEISQRWSHAGYVFVGFIDRIDRPLGGGPITIYDYKTGYLDDDPAAYLDKVRNGDESQLALYWAMRRAQNDIVSRIALISVRDPRDPAWLLALDIVDDPSVEHAPPLAASHDGSGIVRATCTPADLRQGIDALVSRCNMLCEEGIEHFAAGDDPPCSFCAYARACRDRPDEEERIFAR